MSFDHLPPTGKFGTLTVALSDSPLPPIPPGGGGGVVVPPLHADTAATSTKEATTSDHVRCMHMRLSKRCRELVTNFGRRSVRRPSRTEERSFFRQFGTK